MSKVQDRVRGSFVRWELMTRSVSEAVSFYQKLLGWGAHDEELADGGHYSHLTQGAFRLGGIYAMAEDLAQRPAAAHWLPYLGVASVDAALAEAKELGAKVTAESFDFVDLGRMALLLDPTGAPFGLWEDRQGAELPRTVAWHELSTHDTEAAAIFYGDMFGWRPDQNKNDAAASADQLRITRLSSAGGPEAALVRLGPKFRSVPAHWMPYFLVDDMESALATIKSEGGRLLAETTSTQLGPQAVAQDPQGAVFGLMRRIAAELN
jgi:uncharacterized protein